MRVLPPLAITAGMLTSSTVAEPASGEQTWNSGTTYAVGDEVISTSLHWTWSSLTGGSNKALPAAAGASNADWKSVGPTNRWRMFWLLNTAPTTGASPLTVVLTPGERIDAIALAFVVADQVTVTMAVDGDEVYSATRALRTRTTLGWYDYFFGAFEQVDTVALWDLPPYTTGVITVTLTRASGDVSLGALVIGRQEYLGEAELGAQSDSRNFSTIERDFAGNADLVQRKAIPTTGQDVWVDKSRVNRIRRVKDDLNAVPAFWSWLDDADDGYFELGAILGIYTRWQINAEHHTQAVQRIELEGM